MNSQLLWSRRLWQAAIGAVFLFTPFGVESAKAFQTGPQVFFSSPFWLVLINQDPLQVQITVETTDHPSTTVTVFYNTSDGTAKAPGDYTPAAGQLTFPPGVNSQTFVVPVIKNGVPEGPVTVKLTLSQAVGADIAIGSSTLTILDQAPSYPDVSFAYASWTVNETDSTVTISVLMLGSPTSAVSVSYATSDGTAVAGKNYVSTSGTLTWQPTEAGTVKSFTIAILNDGVVDPTLTVNLTLSNQVNAVLGTQKTALLYILDASAPCP